MNIFYLDRDPVVAAQMCCDKHVVKMILETAQLLSTAWHLSSTTLPSGRIYKPTHANHPSAVWARSSRAAYVWLFQHGDGLLAEYTLRYGKQHACEDVFDTLSVVPPLPRAKFVPPPQCMPDAYKQEDTVQAYRAYYVGDKSRFARWRTTPPRWWPDA